jgi:hypothetical protein
MNKKVFISYSRKDTLDIAEFKTIKKFRDFEIVIDDEEVPFNQLWKDNIRQKLMTLMQQYFLYLKML